MRCPPTPLPPANSATKEEERLSRRYYGAAWAAWVLSAVLIMWKGHLGPNGQIYAYFARLSNHGVDVLNPHAQASWVIPWHFLDFTPFNLVVYKLLFALPGRGGEWFFRFYQFGWLGVALLCIGRLAGRGLLTRAQEISLLLLTACNLPLFLLVIGISEDKTYYFALPLLVLALAQRPCPQAFVTGLWAAWSGLGLFFLPVAAVDALRRKGGRGWLLGLLGAGTLLAALPFFPESRVMFANRAAREALAPFWFSAWRLVAPLYSPALNQSIMLLYAGVVWVLHARGRLAFAPALVAICLSYCLFSNNTAAGRNYTTLFLAVLLIRNASRCFLFAGVVVVQELLVGLSKLRVPHALGLFDPSHPGTPVLLVNVLLVNLPVVVAMGIAFSHVERSRGSIAVEEAKALPAPVSPFAG